MFAGRFCETPTFLLICASTETPCKILILLFSTDCLLCCFLGCLGGTASCCLFLRGFGENSSNWGIC
jgi:hypothetical protein